MPVRQQRTAALISDGPSGCPGPEGGNRHASFSPASISRDPSRTPSFRTQFPCPGFTSLPCGKGNFRPGCRILPRCKPPPSNWGPPCRPSSGCGLGGACSQGIKLTSMARRVECTADEQAPEHPRVGMMLATSEAMRIRDRGLILPSSDQEIAADRFVARPCEAPEQRSGRHP